MVVIDSDLIIKYLRKKPKFTVDYLNKLFDNEERLKTTIFNYAELLEGAYLTNNVPKNLRYIKDFLAKFEILPFQTQDADLFSQIHAQLLKSGTPVGDMDVLIACIVLNRGETLVTRNTKHFSRIPMLKIQDWSENPSPSLENLNSTKN
jgi:tRNA(fMet)-specific endonuclease VapC